MPCIAMHLAVAKKYCENNVTEDKTIFELGAIEPDLALDKVESHYGIRDKVYSIKQSLENKIDIKKCLADLDIEKPQDRAKFLHLITDYLYYRYIYVESVEQMSREALDQALYNDYNHITYYVLDKYKINIPSKAQHLVVSKYCDGDFEFITRQQVDAFIEKVSGLNLRQVAKEVLNKEQDFVSKFMKVMNS